MLDQIEAVEGVLKDIGADAPVLRVYNKIDLSGEEAKIIYAEPTSQIECMFQLILVKV